MSRQRGANDRQTNGQLVKGLRRRPLTAKTRVRFSYWLLETSEVIRKFQIVDKALLLQGFAIVGTAFLI